MADTKITVLTAITTVDPAVDVLPIVDVSDTTMAASGTTKKITSNQILGAGGTATLASATISGDLTVDTSTLKVDSTNNRVGIGTASPSNSLDVIGSGVQTVRVGSSNGDLAIFSMFSNGNATWSLASDTVYRVRRDSTEHHRIDATGVATWSNVGGVAGTAMTLNSTGLGVGTTPGNGKIAARAGTSATGNSLYLENIDSTYNPWIQVQHSSSGIKIFNSSSFGGSSNNLIFGNGTTSETMRIDSSGNVGIGVTPSAWAAGYKVIQGQIGGFALSNDNSSNNQFRLSSNAYFDTTDNRWEYYGTSTATAYEQRAGEHRFYNAISGSANTLIPFVQAMTLDASGNLLVASTSTSLTTGTGLKILQNSGVTTVGTVGSSSSDVDTTYRLYSSTASAYRFYVGYGGTVYATNTTISAISDARLKENVQDIDVGLGAILALKPRKFDWKEGKGKNIKGDRGFIAQEFEQVFPQLVDEWADPAPEGEAPYKSVRQDLIPVLVKAIQELTARVQTLETR